MCFSLKNVEEVIIKLLPLQKVTCASRVGNNFHILKNKVYTTFNFATGTVCSARTYIMRLALISYSIINEHLMWKKGCGYYSGVVAPVMLLLCQIKLGLGYLN